MKIADFKDLVKVNQIHPIKQEYFGKSMNLVRIKIRIKLSLPTFPVMYKINMSAKRVDF